MNGEPREHGAGRDRGDVHKYLDTALFGYIFGSLLAEGGSFSRASSHSTIRTDVRRVSLARFHPAAQLGLCVNRSCGPAGT